MSERGYRTEVNDFRNPSVIGVTKEVRSVSRFNIVNVAIGAVVIMLVLGVVLKHFHILGH